MSANNVKLDMQIVSPEQASQWKSANGYKFQRLLKQAGVDYYAGEMTKGDFDPTTVIWFGRVGNGAWQLLDGQHRLAAVEKSGVSQPFLVKRVTYASENDLANAYARIDQGFKRTPGDQAKAWQLPVKYGLAPTWITTFTAGLNFIAGDFGWRRRDKVHPRDMHALMDDYQGAMLDYYASCGKSQSETRKPLQRAATVGVALVSFRFSSLVFGKDKVNEFWEGVALDDGLKRDDPRKTAHDHLLVTSMAYGTGRGKTVTAPYSARWLASCFNAWVEGRSLQHAKPDPSRPMLILGSPFNGK